MIIELRVGPLFLEADFDLVARLLAIATSVIVGVVEVRTRV